MTSSPSNLPLPVYMPDGRPAPYILTADEAAALLRIESRNPDETLLYYRQQGLLRGIKLGRHVRYTLPEIVSFIARQVEAVAC